MGKAILTSKHEPGRICDITEQGEVYPVHKDYQWRYVEDDSVTTTDKWEFIGSGPEVQVVKFDATTDPTFVAEGYKIARAIAYRDVGEQLDMLYREVRDTGSIDTTGEWFQHVASVKAAIPKDDPAAVLQWYADNAPNSN